MTQMAQAHKKTEEAAKETTKSPRRYSYRNYRPLPLRTWLVVLTVLVCAFGLFASSFAVYSVMRGVF